MSNDRRIRTHAPKIPKEEKREHSLYHKVKNHHRQRAEKQAKMRGEGKKQEFDSIAHLHGALGNRKVTELHRSGKLMAMLKMSRPGDRYEREADQIASQVMNTNPGTVHENSSAKVAPKVDLSKVSRKKGGTTETQIKNLSGGEKLDGGTKKFFKSRFDGLDLSKVNIHKGRKANNMANSINARAFTYGNNIVFNKGEYKPNTFHGKKLLAHELAHVAQQTGAQPKKFSRKIKMDEPGKKRVNALNISKEDRQQALKSFEGRNKYSKTTTPSPKIVKKHSITKIDSASKAVAKSQTNSPAPPVKVSSTQGKVVQGWWGKKDDDKEKEEDKEEGKKPKGIGGFAWWAFKNLLGLIGIDVDQFTAILSKAGDALGAIIKDPKGFFGNLGKAVKGGINNFVKNFKKHLLNGIAGWLFGNLGDAGLELPSSFDFKGILSIILQVIGLTYNNIRTQIVKGLGKGGEEMMSHAESMFEHLKTAITEGPMALWEQLKEHLAGLKDQFFGMIIDWVKSTVIKQGVMFLISMLNPAGAIVQAVRAIIKVVTFFMERWQQIQDFASSVVDSVSLIAKGDVTSAQNGVENSLAKAMPLTISFIAKLVGLGGISKHIKKVIKKIQKPINNAIKKVTGKIAKKIKALPIFKKGKKALDKGKKKLDQAKKKVEDVKEKAENKVKDKANEMKDKVEKSRADKQKKKEEEAKEKSRKGKNEHEDKEQLTEKDKKKHQVYVSEIIQKLKADKGNNAKSFKEFHASKVKLAKDLEGRYQKKLKKGINIDITIPPLERDKKDNDVDFKVKIAPNTTQQSDAIEFKGEEEEVGLEDAKINVIVPFSMAGEGHKLKVRTEDGKLMLYMASQEEPLDKKWEKMQKVISNYVDKLSDMPKELEEPVMTDLGIIETQLNATMKVLWGQMENIEDYYENVYKPSFVPGPENSNPRKGKVKKMSTKLAGQLRGELSEKIKGVLRDVASKLSGISKQYKMPDITPLGLEKIRISQHLKPLQDKMNSILDEFKDKIDSSIPSGTKVRYRGSLASGIRSFKNDKKLSDAAELINPDEFDADIYLEVTNEVFKDIIAKYAPDLEGEEKLFLRDTGNWPYKRQILDLQKAVQKRLEGEGWYKLSKKTGKPDFFFVIQTSGMSSKQERDGTEFPKGALEKAGLPEHEDSLKESIGKKRREDDSMSQLEGQKVKTLHVKPVTYYEKE